jgi:hypothetical protein
MAPGEVAAPKEAGTVPVRVQVIDLEPRLVDIVVPTYLKSEDLTQRIARDVGLGGWWEDGTRRVFHLRARGRVMRPDERLEDVGVVSYELLHLLPEPRPGSPVQERPSGVPTEVSPPVSRSSRIFRWFMAISWAMLWAVAADGSPTGTTAWWPSFGLAFCASYALRRHGTPVWTVRSLLPVFLTATALGVPAVVLGTAAAPGLMASSRFAVLAILGGGAGVLMSALAWMGPLEVVRGRVEAAATVVDEVVAMACGICAQPAGAEVSEACPYGCGRVFHRGCLRARQSVAQGPGCEVCGADVGRG